MTDDTRRARRAGQTAACAATAFTLLYAVAVLTRDGQRVDSLAMVRAWFLAPTLTAWCTAALTAYHAVTYAALVAACLGVALWRSGPRRTAAAALTLLATVTSAEALKHGLPRPDLAWVPGPRGALSVSSYPSGHTAGIVGLVAAAVVAARPGRRLRTAVIGGLVSLPVAAAIVVAQWHRPSDVVGSYLLATTWAALAVAALEPATWRVLAALPGRRPALARAER